MNTSKTAFTAFYVQWFDSVRALIPGGASARPAVEATRSQEQVAANQEWEDEGGSVRPPKDKPGATPAPKLPL